jgi:DNA polymerase-3 subunit beta
MTTIATLHPKTIATAYLFQAHKDVRYYLNGIHLEAAKDGIIATATDGQRLIIVSDTNATLETDMIISFDSGFVTKCKNRKADLVTITQDGDTVLATVTSETDSDFMHISKAEIIDGRFPDWRAVAPAALPDTAQDPGAFNSIYLASFCNAAKLLHDKYPTVRVYSNGPNHAAQIAIASGFAGITACGVLMPRKTDADIYNWTDTPAKLEAVA